MEHKLGNKNILKFLYILGSIDVNEIMESFKKLGMKVERKEADQLMKM